MIYTHFLFISGTEITFILFIVILVFGADKIPSIAKGLGKGMRTLKDATNDIKGEIQKSADKNGIDTSISKDVKEELDKVKDEINDLTGSVRRNL
jgi:sec-independent protein translocase protein TatA